MNFDKGFIFNCLKNDLGKDSGAIKVRDTLQIDLDNEEVSGSMTVNATKKDFDHTICDIVNSEEFSYLVRYGLLNYSCFVKSENEFTLDISAKAPEALEDITIEELVSEELNFFFYDNLLKTRENIGSFGDFQAVVSSLFAISMLPKGKTKTYAFFVTGLELTKDNLMKLKESNDQVPGIDHITFIDCVCEDRDFVTKFFEKSTVIDFK